MANVLTPNHLECEPIAVVNADAIVANFRIAKTLHRGRVMAVVKADAYGHGLREVARALEPVADAFAVQSVKEAVCLRNESVTLPILVLGGCVSCDDFHAAAHHQLWVAANEYARTAQMLETVRTGTLAVWLNLRSRLNRGGLSATEAALLARRIRRSPNVRVQGVMSHIGYSHSPGSHGAESYAHQVDFVRAIHRLVGGDRSVHTTDTILAGANDADGWARVGSLLYGLVKPDIRTKLGLLSTMSFESTVREVHGVRCGDSVGYGATFRAARDMVVGIVPVGYAHGYPRTTGRGPDVLVGRSLASVVGAVSMNGLVLDLTNVPWVDQGEKVTLWGASPSIYDVAHSAGVVPEVLTTAVGNAARSGVVARRLGDSGVPAQRSEAVTRLRSRRQICQV